MSLEGRIFRGAGAVTSGTMLVQTGGVLSQFLYAFWLSPSDFGVWATASASVILLGSMTNAGEANGYLAGTSLGLGGLLRRTFRINAVLATLALFVAMLYWWLGQPTVSLIVALLALELPLQGRAAMFVAGFIKSRLHSQLVLVQALATLLRLVVGITVVIVWQSPVALGIALLVNTCAMVLLTRIKAGRHCSALLAGHAGVLESVRKRCDRAVHQFSQTVPTQIDYLTVSIVASPQILGLYFFAYQATGALSGLISGPLAKTAVAELSSAPQEERSPVVGRLLVVVVALSTLLCSLLGGALFALDSFLPAEWLAVVSPLIVLLASLPPRFIVPITEALNMVNGRWRRSSAVNFVDAAGTAAAASAAFLADVTVLAIAITAWKACFGYGRALLAFRGMRVRTFVVLIAPSAISVSITAWSVHRFDGLHMLSVSVIVALAALQLIAYRLIASR